MIKIIAAIAITLATIAFNVQAGLMETNITDLSNKYGVTAYSNGNYIGGAGSSSADLSSSSVNLSGQLQTNSYLPTLKAISTNGYGRLVSIQAFQYTGQSLFDLDLSINLHGSSSGTGYNNGIRADVGIIDAGFSPLSGYDGYYFGYDFATIYFEPSEGYSFDNTSLFIDEEQDVNKQDTLSISLDTNQYFYVITQLTVKAENGGVSDAWNTLGMKFSDTSNLLSAQRLANPLTTSVPEPSTWMLLSLALLGFSARRKIK
jgi:hypothetical protein